MSQTYFTADWHFSHPNIARYCPQFRLQSDNTNELNEYLIDCWNRVVTPQDTVYNLGDVCFAKNPAHIEAVLQRLNGQHHLIYGNHDYLIRQNEAYFLNTRKADGHPLLSSASHYLRLKLPEISNTAILCHTIPYTNGTAYTMAYTTSTAICTTAWLPSKDAPSMSAGICTAVS